jgi:hypothetical protein
MRRQPRQVSRLPPALADRFTLEPGDPPDHMHGHGRAPVLERRARQAAVATLAQRQAPDALREATLDARPECLWLFARGRLLALSRGLHRVGVGVGADGALPGGILRRGTHLTGGTGTTGGSGKADPHPRSAGDLGAWGPCDPRLPWGTAGLVGVPI